MIYEINQMIDHLDDFFKNSHKETIVGGIAGTQIERFTLDAALQTTSFDKILVVNGCQDYIGLMKKPMQNVMFWGDLFIEQIVDPLIPVDPWKPKIFNPREEYIRRINTQILSMYDIVIVFNAHLVPYQMLKVLSENFGGKIVYVLDPVEGDLCTSYNMGINDMPVIVDHLEKVSPMIALARSSIGYESRAVDYNVRGSLTETTKFNKRSIGKIDDKQYITNDYELYREVFERQLDSPFRKNQKVRVVDNNIDVMYENGQRHATLVNGSTLVIENPSSTPLMRLRLYNSKIIYAADVTYQNGVMKPKGSVSVVPANILNHEEDFIKHRYNHTVLILNHEISKRSRYNILKNSNNVTIVNRFK